MRDGEQHDAARVSVLLNPTSKKKEKRKKKKKEKKKKEANCRQTRL